MVTNDLRLSGTERILVITGPNNGGKTTMARTVGQLHHLAALGCPVPGRDVRLFLPDAIYSHFERREDPAAMAGKLQEELQRFADDFARAATASSLIVMNEMFSSTTVQDALYLSRAMLQRISDLGALGVCVTFLDELTTFDETTVSMVSSVDPDDPATRTYKVIRRRGRRASLRASHRRQIRADPRAAHPASAAHEGPAALPVTATLNRCVIPRNRRAALELLSWHSDPVTEELVDDLDLLTLWKAMSGRRRGAAARRAPGHPGHRH